MAECSSGIFDNSERIHSLSDDYNSRKGIPALACGFASLIAEPLKYPKSLKTIADHIKKRRMDLRLF
jgi:hypothetical protein